MAIGKIIDLPNQISAYARVRDENNEEYTVSANEIPKGSDIGDDYAYHVDVWHNPSGEVTTLRHGSYEKEE